MTKLKIALAAAALLGLSSAATMAMPMSNLAATDAGVKADSVRLVCNAWGRCWHRPNYYRSYGYGYYPRYRYRHYGRRW